MKRLTHHLLCWLLAAAVPAIGSAQDAPAAPVGDPGYYGQVDLADNPPPPLVYSTPVVVQPDPYGTVYPPIYLRVPSMYYMNWGAYCGYYNACFYPVFFVQDAWYLNWYGPWYRRYYPYGRPGFVAHVVFHGGWGGHPGYAPHGGQPHGGWHGGGYYHNSYTPAAPSMPHPAVHQVNYAAREVTHPAGHGMEHITMHAGGGGGGHHH